MKVLTVFGTRPEAIKMAPLALALAADPRLDARICVTAQHRQMLDQVLNLFALTPEYDLDLMRPGQTLTGVTAGILAGMEPVLSASQPDVISVHGDTATTFAATVAAHYFQHISVGHVEAVLRAGKLYAAWAEEGNRRLNGAHARYHFAPTNTAGDNLLRKGASPDHIAVTGNTLIDALLTGTAKLDADASLNSVQAERFGFLDPNKRQILVTSQRGEKFGGGFKRICLAWAQTGTYNPHTEILYPVYLNPNVQAPVNRLLNEQPNIHLIEPLDYLLFVYLMNRAHLVLTSPTVGQPSRRGDLGPATDASGHQHPGGNRQADRLPAPVPKALRLHRLQRAGIPIGSGGIESPNKSISHLRLKRFGASGILENGNGMLRPHCALSNGPFNRVFQNYPFALLQQKRKTWIMLPTNES